MANKHDSSKQEETTKEEDLGSTLTHKPHDHLFRYVFSNPEHARGELEHLLPDELSKRIDWDTLAPLPADFIPEDLRELQADLLFSVKLGKRDIFLYLLLEHQSSNDHWLVLRLLIYITEIAKRFRKQKPEATKLPAIVPLVVHHSNTGWTAPQRFSDLLDLSQDEKHLLSPYLLDFSFLLDDLSKTQSEELKARSASELARLALYMLKNSRSSQNILENLVAWTDIATDVLEATNGVAALAAILNYIMQVTKMPIEQVEEATKKLGPKAEKAFISTADILIAKGKAEGKAEVVLRMLQLKFGSLSSSAEQSIQSATSDQLDKLVELIVNEDSLDKILSSLN